MSMRIKLPSKSVTEIDHVRAGESVRQLRKHKGKSLRWLAKQLGFSPPFVSDLERGRRNWTQIGFESALKILNQVKS